LHNSSVVVASGFQRTKSFPVRDLISLRYEKNSQDPLMGQVLDFVNKTPHIKTVILSTHWHAFVNSKHRSYELLCYKNGN